MDKKQIYASLAQKGHQFVTPRGLVRFATRSDPSDGEEPAKLTARALNQLRVTAEDQAIILYNVDPTFLLPVFDKIPKVARHAKHAIEFLHLARGWTNFTWTLQVLNHNIIGFAIEVAPLSDLALVALLKSADVVEQTALQLTAKELK